MLITKFTKGPFTESGRNPDSSVCKWIFMLLKLIQILNLVGDDE